MASGIWSATDSARNEDTLRNAALSVRQRKLLALLDIPLSAEDMSKLSGIPQPEVDTNLQRFERLGLVTIASTLGNAPGAMRPSNYGENTSDSTKSKLPIIIGGIALTAVAGAIWFFTQGGSTSSPQAPSPASVASAPGASTAPPTPSATSEAPSSATSVFVSGGATPPPASDTNEANKAAATKEPPRDQRDAAKEAAAKEAVAKDAAAREAARKAAAQPALAASPTPVASPPVATAPAPAAVTSPPPAPAAPPPTAPPPVATAVPPTPAPAAAAPRPAAPREGKIISRVEPDYPRNTDVERATITARITINAQGSVTNVEIVEATHAKIFDRNVRLALNQWKYEATGEQYTKLVNITFVR